MPYLPAHRAGTPQFEELRMTNVVQLRDYQNRRDIERLYAEFAQDCSLATSIALIPHDKAVYESSIGYVDTAPSEYCAPVSDPA